MFCAVDKVTYCIFNKDSFWVTAVQLHYLGEVEK